MTSRQSDRLHDNTAEVVGEREKSPASEGETVQRVRSTEREREDADG
jgi:hypothetical protein